MRVGIETPWEASYSWNFEIYSPALICSDEVLTLKTSGLTRLFTFIVWVDKI